MIPIPKAPLDEEQAARGAGRFGATAGGMLGGAAGAGLGYLHGATRKVRPGFEKNLEIFGKAPMDIVPSKNAKLKALLAGLGLAAAGATGGYFGGKALGRRASQNRREREMGDLRAKMEMMKQLQAQA